MSICLLVHQFLPWHARINKLKNTLNIYIFLTVVGKNICSLQTETGVVDTDKAVNTNNAVNTDNVINTDNIVNTDNDRFWINEFI